MTPDTDEALTAFTTDSRDLLDQMEEALLLIEQQPEHAHALHVAHKAAHTIKVSASVVGLRHIVAFAHVAENVLGKARQGDIRFDADLATLMFASGDHIRVLVALVDKRQRPDEDQRARGEALIERLASILLADVSAAVP